MNSFVFSRFEYALLNTGYILERSGGVAADWDRFAKEHDQAFSRDSSEQLQKAVRYYEAHPPKKQVIDSGQLTVKEAIPKEKELLLRLLILVRRVRNNLFHGEKFTALLAGESERDTDLLENGLLILHDCLTISTNVGRSFYREKLWELDREPDQGRG